LNVLIIFLAFTKAASSLLPCIHHCADMRNSTGLALKMFLKSGEKL